MLSLDFSNPAARQPFATLRGLLGCLLSRRYHNFFSLAPDYVTNRGVRTRGTAAVEVELFEDGSGLEVAAFGWWLLVGVELKRGAVVLSRP